jgi:hypothetical protein
MTRKLLLVPLFGIFLQCGCSSPLRTVRARSWSAGGEGTRPETIRVEQSRGGRLLTVELAPLRRATKVRRARLFARRAESAPAEELLADVEIYAGASEKGRPLELVGPWYDRFDATDAAQKALRKGRRLELFVKSFPSWETDTTRLEVMSAGEPAAPVPPVKGLSVFHRSGQTFLTWREVNPLVTTEEVTWGEIREKLEEASDACTYRIYAHGEPITAENLFEAELLAEVGPLSAYNFNARNVEYLIAQAMIKPDRMGELTQGNNGLIYRWHMDDRRMYRYPVARFVIDEGAGPLAVGTGLYVHSPRSPGKRYYAVVSSGAGAENTRDFSAENSLAEPVEETVGLGGPVCQGDGLWGPYFDYPGRRKVYVQWTAPPLSPRPNMYYNWSVLVPPGCEGPAPLELYFHSGNYSYAKPNSKFMRGSIQIAPHDWPFSGWYGYNEAVGTLKSFRSCSVRDHTQQRVLAFLEWAKQEFPIDPDRIIAVGGDGAAAMALGHPDVFAYVLITGFEERLLNRKAVRPFQRAWGPKSPHVSDGRGRSEWTWAEFDKVVLAKPEKDLLLFVCKGGSWGRMKGWGIGRGRFYSAMHEARQPLYAHWAWGEAWTSARARPFRPSLTPPQTWRAKAVATRIPSTRGRTSKTRRTVSRSPSPGRPAPST